MFFSMTAVMFEVRMSKIGDPIGNSLALAFVFLHSTQNRSALAVSHMAILICLVYQVLLHL